MIFWLLLNGPLSEVPAHATVTSCELANIAADARLTAAGQTQESCRASVDLFHNVSCLSAGGRVNPRFTSFSFSPSWLHRFPFCVKKNTTGLMGILIKREKRLNKGKQQCGLGKLLSGIKKNKSVPAEAESWWGSGGCGWRCTLCAAQLLMWVFLSSHRFRKWLSTPGAQLALWGVSECVHSVAPWKNNTGEVGGRRREAGVSVQRYNQGCCSLLWVIPNWNPRPGPPNQGAGASESWCISCPVLQALTLLSCCVLSLGWRKGGGGGLHPFSEG